MNDDQYPPGTILLDEGGLTVTDRDGRRWRIVPHLDGYLFDPTFGLPPAPDGCPIEMAAAAIAAAWMTGTDLNAYGIEVTLGAMLSQGLVATDAPLTPLYAVGFLADHIADGAE